MLKRNLLSSLKKNLIAHSRFKSSIFKLVGEKTLNNFVLIENDLVYFRMSVGRQQINVYQKVTKFE